MTNSVGFYILYTQNEKPLTRRHKMKKFKITVTAVREFTVPDNATDEEYDELKAVAIMGMNEDKITPDKVKVELIDAPDEIKAKYIINKDCQD